MTMKKTYLTPVNDKYETCERTKALLRINCSDRSPHAISKILQIEPTKVVEVGVEGPKHGTASGAIGKLNLWVLDSEGAVESKDLRRHLDWLLDQIEPAAQQILELRREGLIMDISCVWWSKYGEGGPALWPTQMLRISQLDLELSIGFAYFAAE
jgi:Domain of unknown function (DUF4279)